MSFAIGISSQVENWAIIARQLFPTEWTIDLVEMGTTQPMRQVSIANFSHRLFREQFAIALEELCRCAVESVSEERATLTFFSEDPKNAHTPSDVARWLVCLPENDDLIDMLLNKAALFIDNFKVSPSEEPLFAISPLIVCEDFASDIIAGYRTLCSPVSSDSFFSCLAKAVRKISKPMDSELAELVRSTSLCDVQSALRLSVLAAILDHHVDFGLPCHCIRLIRGNLERYPAVLNRDERYWLDHCQAAIAYLEGHPPSWYAEVRELETMVLFKRHHEAERWARASGDWHIHYRQMKLSKSAGVDSTGTLTNASTVDSLDMEQIISSLKRRHSLAEDGHHSFMEKFAQK